MTDTIKQIEEAKKWLDGFDNDYGKNDPVTMLKAALSALQKIASGDDWFDIESAPIGEDIAVLVMGGHFETELYEPEEYTEPIKVRCGNGVYWPVIDACYYECFVNAPTHWKHIDGEKHIAMLLEAENDRHD